MNKQHLLFLTIFLEGYAVLATELLAVRGLVPFVGSGVEVVSIIIGAILMPLAIGYWAGGRRARVELHNARQKGKHSISLRVILQKNLLTALMFLTIGLSYITQSVFFDALKALGLHNRIAVTAVYSCIFLIVPTYLLAQTIPLVSHYFSRTKLSEITGRMLFFSTVGSFCGSIISTIVFMTVLGVHNTVIITLFIIVALVFVISPRGGAYVCGLALMFGGIGYLINNDDFMKEMHVVADTPYSLISVEMEPKEDSLILSINRSQSSKFAVDPEKRFPYLKYIENNFIAPMTGGEPKNILVLGAGGFVVGWEDHVNRYTFVDIDAKLKDVSEQHFLPEKLSPNKKFVATSARDFLIHDKEKYDLIFIDLFSNVMSIPAESISREFLLSTKLHLKENGALLANIVSDPAFNDRFTVRYYNTFASVFHPFDRHVIGAFNAWRKDATVANTLYIYFNKPEAADDRAVYTDDKNTYSFDH